MIDLNKDLDERDLYLSVPVADRWIFNKLYIAERQGHNCGPCGTVPPTPGDYCIRPIYNLAGMGDGGVMKWNYDGTPETALPIIPGWFWCEWFTGYHEWVDYTDDEPVRWSGGLHKGRRWVLEDMRDGGPRNPRLPGPLRGLSKHLLVEWIGGKIIEVAPRHQKWLDGKENQIDYWAQRWTDPYFGYETYFWKVVPKVQ